MKRLGEEQKRGKEVKEGTGEEEIKRKKRGGEKGRGQEEVSRREGRGR